MAAVSLAALGLVACGQKDAPAPAAAAPAGPPPTPTLEQLKGATVSGVFDQAVTLANGKYDGPPAEPGAASHPTLMLWESAVAFGDMDGAPGNEAVALLSSNSGGSGEFVYIAVFGVRDGQLVNLGTAEVGDRVKLRTPLAREGQGNHGRRGSGPEGPGVLPDAAGPQDLRDGRRRAQAGEQRSHRHDHDRYAGLHRVDARVASTASLFRPD